MEQVFMEVELAELRPNPWNPKTRCDGKEFDELVASVRAKGVIQPILIRPVESKNVTHEIVAGERRFQALLCVAKENGGAGKGTIPAVVRELSDDEAFELTMIENLQRKDLTELEEAQGFKKYLDRKGMDALPELAERTGINERYIRRRVAVLGQPKKALKAWDKGEIKYGHLEQLCRLKDKSEIDEYIRRIIEWRGGYSVSRMRSDIDDKAPELKHAKFDLKKTGCLSCAQNSDIQKELFGDLGEIKKTRCLNPACFKRNQNNYLTKNWKTSGYRKQHGTNGFRFSENLSYNDWTGFYSRKVPAECKACPKFVTLIHVDGTVDEGRACLGDSQCYNNKTNIASQSTKSNAKKNTDDGAPRVAWHGEHFREMFFDEQLPLRFADLPATDVKTLRLALMSLLCSNTDLHGWFATRYEDERALKEKQKRGGSLGWYRMSETEMCDIIFDLDLDRLREELREASLQVVLQKNTVYATGRRLVGEHLGIDLSVEWRLHKEYLEKKTIKEMMVLGDELGIFADKKAEAFVFEVLGKRRKGFTSCKKAELIRVFLESGVDLAGKVPKEILAKDKQI